MFKLLGKMCSPWPTIYRVVVVLVDVMLLIGEIICCVMVPQVLLSMILLLLYAIDFVIPSLHEKMFMHL